MESLAQSSLNSSDLEGLFASLTTNVLNPSALLFSFKTLPVEVFKHHSSLLVKYSLSAQQPISFHIPILRALSGIIQVISGSPSLNLKEIFSSLPAIYPSLLLDYPLRIQALVAQIDAGMWRRNGTCMIGQRAFYRAPFFADESEADIFLIQVCSVLLGPEHFLRTLVLRYEIERFFELPNPFSAQSDLSMMVSDDDDKVAQLVDESLKMITIISSHRGFTGPQSRTKNFILHLLCEEDLTHAGLISKSPNRIAESADFETTLNEVAHFRSSDKKYVLKPEYWSSFDPFFLHYSKSMLEQATERFMNQKQKPNNNSSSSSLKNNNNLTLLPFVPNQVTYPEFTPLNEILNNPILHSMLFILLYKSTKGLIPDALFDTILQVLLKILTNPTTSNLYPPPSTSTNDSSPPTISTNLYEIPYHSEDLRKNSRTVVTVYENKIERHLTMIELIQQLKGERKDRDKTFEFILKYLIPPNPSLPIAQSSSLNSLVNLRPSSSLAMASDPCVIETSDDTSELEKEKKRREARERKAAILAQFSAKQKTFIQGQEKETLSPKSPRKENFTQKFFGGEHPKDKKDTDLSEDGHLTSDSPRKIDDVEKEEVVCVFM
eukprot:TRINITY_DN1236_c0_g6_i1.p1 TRINITY_DN1236_c0_g6~~TRINITY_DN1236_c0_g6_i1.p1  ORF type:complete len:606 (-),score=142.95 TRINITY_DN1236_c0_g6_i1:555-2372(-)